MGLVLLGAGAGAVCLGLPGYWAFLVGTVAVTVIVGAGLNVLLGLAGEVSLGHAGFMALGAYATALLELRAGAPFGVALGAAVGISAVLGLALSVPALRVTGPYLAMVTIAFGFIVENVAVEWRGLTGGASGLPGVPAPWGTQGMGALCCVVARGALAAFAWLARSPAGLAMQAVATAPRAAEAIGIAPVPARTLAFVIAAAAGGLGGGLQAGLVGFIAPSSFPFSSSILLLLVVVVGGAGWTLGPLLGAVVVAAVPELLSGLAEYRLLVFGALLLVVLWVAPGGIAGALARVRPGARGAAAAGGVLGAGPGGAGLAAAGVRLAFGGVPALQGVGLTAPAGVVTSVIGPNGAGKSTFLNVLSGFQAAEGGTVRVGGAVLPRSAWRVARAGVARTFQTAQLFPGLSVVDNVRLGLLRGRWRGAADAGVAAGLLGAVGYCGSFGTLAGSLAHVDRRLVELARALATGPSVLLLDEPAAGLDAGDTARLGPVLRAAAAGRAVVLVEHDMGLVMSVSDRVVVLDAGRVIAEGRPAEVRADPAVIAAYLGARAVKPRTARPAGTTALEVSGLEAGYGGVGVLSGVSLRVKEGGVLAVLGPNGAGKSTLMQALAGLVRPGAGSVVLAGWMWRGGPRTGWRGPGWCWCRRGGRCSRR